MVKCGGKCKGEFMRLIGDYLHTIDAKGRVIVPSKFREQLGNIFIITKGFDNSLTIYSENAWNELEDKLSQMSMISADSRIIRRMIVGSATEVVPDKQGRIIITPSQKEYAKIDKEVVFSGNLDHVEIWSKEEWDNIQNMDTAKAAEKLYQSGIKL